MFIPPRTKRRGEFYGKTALWKNLSTEKQSAVSIGLLKMKVNKRLLRMVVYVI